MAKSKKSNRGLGRGLSALMSDVTPTDELAQTTQTKESVNTPIEMIAPNPDQPRRQFDTTKLEELAQSIRHRGIIQPLVVREKAGPSGEKYQIVAGERRWRASQLAGLHDVPVIVRTFSDEEVLEVAIIENIQRSELNPIDEGLGYRQLIETHGHTQDQLSQYLGKSRSHIANQMRLLSLPDDIKSMVSSGTLSSGHARAILTAEEPLKLAQMVVAKGLSVRETEKRAKATKTSQKPTPLAAKKDSDTIALEGELSAHLKMDVRINHLPGDDGGKVTLTYRSLEQLDDLIRVLSS